MDKIILPPHFDLNKAHNKGLVFDGLWKAWMKVYHQNVIIPPEDDAPFDACLSDVFYDVKLMPERSRLPHQHEYFVYISHNEYLFGKEKDTVYDVYVEDSDVAERLIQFSFSEAKELGAITLFADGKWVHCKVTGQTEPPWSINVSRILQMRAAAELAVLK